jgi:Flp pilus assembly protein TadG
MCVFLLIMLLIGVVEIGRMVLVYTTIANAARAGTRYAIVHGTDSSVTPDQVRAVVRNYLSAAPMTAGSADVNVTYGVSSMTIGSTVTVQVSYLFDPLTTYFPLSVNLGSTSEGVITF